MLGSNLKIRNTLIIAHGHRHVTELLDPFGDVPGDVADVGAESSSKQDGLTVADQTLGFGASFGRAAVDDDGKIAVVAFGFACPFLGVGNKVCEGQISR